MMNKTKIPTIKEFMISKLSERNIDKFSNFIKDRMKMADELQSLLIEYTDTYNQHFAYNYIYVYFDFGSIFQEKQLELKHFLHELFRFKDCIGSLNIYKSNFNGLLLMHKNILADVREQMTKIPELQTFDIEGESSNIQFRVHDKWGRYNSLILFD